MIQTATAFGLAGVSGLALGSYAVTAGIRYARAEPSAYGRSHCDSCGATLGALQTVPIISHIRSRGACPACHARIDPTHMVGEFAGLLVVATALSAPSLLRAPILAGLGLLLVTVATVDWKIGRLPDPLTLTIALAAMVLAALRSWSALEVGLLASLATFGLLQAVRWVFGRLRGDPGMGFGDVKLICGLALWTGTATPWLFVGATALGLGMMALIRPASGRLPFGPALAISGWLVGMGGEWGLWPTTV